MSDHLIDLRSDTVTQPSPGMRRAIAEAEVGDDVLDGDPTTRRLEERVAALLGKEAALFFPSGTQANQVAVHVLAPRGSEVIVEAEAHMVHFEKAAAAVLSGVQLLPVRGTDGMLAPEHVAAAVRPGSVFLPRTSLIAVENTHNAAGGRVSPPAVMDAIAAVARERGLPVHVDGARLWNAAVAAEVPPARLVRDATTVMVSFSKGLGCPVGSCLAGPRAVLEEAWHARARFGGGMRQTGILTAACLYALDHNLERLGQDHVHAQLLADRLRGHATITVVPPETNIVMLDLHRHTAEDAIPRLAAAGVKLSRFGPRRVRAVTHLNVTREEVERAGEIIGDTLGG
ncbi:MAG: aminotransferase class I/II-fold pyridoxal phosphate-dependent enzyme [Gemmatimonadetes bacterium]|nr:aminotransferase class I/II-fold pyridoxal phosphate-dependent enzyme [Gemmatimonadota bacterium]